MIDVRERVCAAGWDTCPEDASIFLTVAAATH
jgi:hypothetical protein